MSSVLGSDDLVFESVLSVKHWSTSNGLKLWAQNSDNNSSNRNEKD